MTELRPTRLHAALLTTLTALGLATEAHAEQVVVLDETWTHTPDLPDSHFRIEPQAGTPSDWTSPIDFTSGSVWVYLEVHTKPTAQETKFQVCFEATPTYACTYQSPTYTEVGTYEWETPFDGFWSPPGEFVDWTQGVNQIACILKDTMNGKPSADNVGDEVAALYTPTEVRMVVTVVEAGSVYEPPTPTGEGGSSSSGGTDDGGSGESGVDASSGGGSGDAGGSEGGAGSSDGGGGTTAAATTDAATGSDSTGAPAAQGDDDGGGCGCRSDRGAPAPGVALLGVMAWLRRRRRH